MMLKNLLKAGLLDYPMGRIIYLIVMIKQLLKINQDIYLILKIIKIIQTIIFITILTACKPSVESLSDEELCKKYYESFDVEEEAKYGATYQFEILRRTITRLDSTVKGVEYRTILSKLPCGPDAAEYDEGDVHVIAWTEDAYKKEFLRQDAYSDLNGEVVYDYEKNEDGSLVKEFVTFLVETGKNEYYRYKVKNDTVIKGDNIEVIFPIDREIIKKFEFYINENGIITGPKKLSKYQGETKTIEYYKYNIKTGLEGVHTFKGLLKVFKTKENEWKEISIKFRYFVHPQHQHVLF